MRCGVAIGPFVVYYVVMGGIGGEVSSPEGSGNVSLPMEGSSPCVEGVVECLLESGPHLSEDPGPSEVPPGVIFDTKAIFNVGV